MTTQFPLPGLPAAETPETDAGQGSESPRRRRRPTREQLLEGLNEPQREAVVHEGAPLLVVAGAGIGQDPRAHPPDRVADLRARRPPRLGPGDHVHQQGRRRDARAGRGAGRRPRQDHVGQHLPLRLRAHPAQGDRQVRLQVELHDLRRGRLQAADDAGLPRPRPRREALPAAGDPQLGQQRQERAAGPRGRRQGRPRTARRRPTPRRTPSTSAASARPTRSTSTTC